MQTIGGVIVMMSGGDMSKRTFRLTVISIDFGKSDRRSEGLEKRSERLPGH